MNERVSENKNLKNIGIVSGATLVSRVLGLLRDAQAASVFGATGMLSAFLTAFQLPDYSRSNPRTGLLA